MSDFLQTKGKQFIYKGQPIQLTGFSFGNWMNIESFMIGLPGCDVQVHDAFVTAYGQEKTDIFYDKYLDTYIKDEDFQYLKSIGANLVRIPFSYRYFADDLNSNAVVDTGFKYLDKVIGLCNKYEIFGILDMHTAPGGVGKDPHSDCTTGYNFFWNFEKLQDTVIDVWERLAERYKDEPFLGGYDLLNEPTKVDNYDVFNRFNNRCISVIRKHDENHIIFVEGLDWSRDFSMLKFDDTRYLAFSFHQYPGLVQAEFPDEPWSKENMKKSINRILSTMSNFDFPIWCGETGISSDNHGMNPWNINESVEVSKAHLTDMLTYFNEVGISWSLWTYKDNIIMGLTRPKDDSYWACFTRELGKHWNRSRKKHSDHVLLKNFVDEIGITNELSDNVVYYVMQNCIRKTYVDYVLIPALKAEPFEKILQCADSFAFENCVVAPAIEAVFKEHVK